MATELPTSPFIDISRPFRPVERDFVLDDRLFMQCIDPPPLPPEDIPPDFLREPRREFLETIAREVAVSANIDRIGGFHEDSCR